MEGYNCKIGKGVLGICMGENYTDATVIFREYVQNATDAIYKAEQQGIISKTDNYVSINTNGGNVEIMDRGVGVSAEKIGPTLIDLGNSAKTNSDIGKYGIGRLSGANWCDQIIFETSCLGEPVRSILSFNSKLARDIINNDTLQECADIMDEVTSYSQEPEDANEHYFRVTLKNVKEELRDEETVHNYLSFIAPVPYDANFYDDCQKKAFNKFPEFKEFTLNEKTCKIHLNGKPVVKPYTSTIDIGNDVLKITPPSFFKIEDEDFGLLAWGWYSINEEARQMGDGVNYKGLRLRAKNMAVGTQDYLISCFKNRTDANYVIGEVFVVHDNIQPTGSRDGIISSPEFKEFEIRMKKKCKEIASVYNAMSKLGSAALNPLIKAQTTIEEKNRSLKHSEITDETKSELKKEIKEQKEIIEKAKVEISNKIKAVDNAENADSIKETVLKHWNKVAKKVASDYNANVKPEQKINPVNIESVVASAVERESPNISEEKTPSDNTGNSVTSGDKSTVAPKDTDVYKKLGKTEHNLMKKVYQVLNAEKRLDDKTKEKIKAKLVKKILAE